MVRSKMAKAEKTTKAKKTAQRSTANRALEIDARFAPIVAAFAQDSQVKCGRMFSSNSVLNVNGKIFAMMTKGKLVVKIPKTRVDELVGTSVGVHFDPGHGRLMKEWVVVAPGKLDWIELAREAYRFVKEIKK